jgi:hypothetical protein
MRYSFAISSSSGVPGALQATNGNPWEALALAIVLQAAFDYRALYALKLLGREQNRPPTEWQGNLTEIERFFHSRWFGKLTSLDGEYLLRMLREKVEQEVLG